MNGRRQSSLPAGRVPLLFLLADTGGGHRSAALAVAEALELTSPGQYAPILLNPLDGPASPWLLRRLTGLYGPAIRLAPWVWGAVYRLSDSPTATALLERTLLRLAERPVADAVRCYDPAAIVSFHALTTAAAVRASTQRRRRVPTVTVVTDLVTAHTAWRHRDVDQIVVPTASVRWRCRLDRMPRHRCPDIGLPVSARFCEPPARPDQRAALKTRLGVNESRFLIVIAGGGEGSGGIAKRAAALINAFDDVQVVAVCGRNRRAQRTLASQSGGRLVVKGFVNDLADWLRCADIVVTKAGPGTIAEATCCGAPLVITSHVPGQEKGNTDFVVRGGAGRHAPTVTSLTGAIGQLRTQPEALAAMRQASANLGRPTAAADIAALITRLAGQPPNYDLQARRNQRHKEQLTAMTPRPPRARTRSHHGAA